ncbi:hypothetical protein BP5796_03315 [Coleophoma crateriformis]|uniref:RNA polymerase II elongation factor ELL N-terminal domain-containing protein n=1 Tax=Coleophoma crateriformis TaxID=565419 RepID=A0A3D8SN71_9HELO|nr:hypothetical protein BP5796_03315 [Coleophoma crateriformis]
MPSLTVPDAGLTLDASRPPSKHGAAGPMAFGLTLADSVIENMIKCFQENKPIHLALGESPKIQYGSKTQHLAPSDDPFTHELYQSTSSRQSSPEAEPRYLAMFSHTQFLPRARPITAQSAAAKSKAAAPASSQDPALAALQGALASENAKKAENTTKYIKDGTLPLPGKRGAAKVTNKSKFLSQNRSLGSDTTRSMPTSPALSGVGSPSLGPTSVPLSQQKAERAKEARRPVIHYLALRPFSEREILSKIGGDQTETYDALQKVADEINGKWELRKNYWKELDVWRFDYGSEDDRQMVIDNAVKQYDKMRMGISEPQWDRLLPKEERGTGKCLSKLQAKIASGSAKAPKISVSQADGSGQDTPGRMDEAEVEDKSLSRVKDGESRSASQPPATKTKKTSEREAQAKRLLSKTGPKPAKPAAKPAVPKKTKAPVEKEREKGKVLSSQYVEDSDDDGEDTVIVSKAPPKPIKRPREAEVDKSHMNQAPASRKPKKDTPTPNHRISDASQSSRSTHQSSTSFKSKGTSPQKSSPLASSPPTNASDFENDHASHGRASSSASPYNEPQPKVKRKREDEEPIRRQQSSSNSSISSSHPPIKRQKSDSISSSSTATSTSSRQSYGLPPNIANKEEYVDLARRFKVYYPRYQQLHKELQESKVHDPEKEEILLDMHDRLSNLKAEIMLKLVNNNLPTKRTQGADWRPITNGGSIDYRPYY